MSINLSQRLVALEQARAQLEPLTLLATFSSPGGPDRELMGLREMLGPMRWERAPHETERDFIDRAEREAPRNPQGIAMLVEVISP